MQITPACRRIFAPAAILAALLPAGCGHQAHPASPAPPNPVASAPVAPAPQAAPSPPVVGQPAPAFATVTTKGRPLTLASLRGHVVLMDYWATWCGPCKMAMPTLEALHRRFASQGLRVVGISVDDASTVGSVPRVVKRLGVHYTIAASPQDDIQAAQDYDAEAIPDQFLIDKKGVIRWAQDGFSPAEGPQLSALIQRLLAEKA